MLEFMGGVFDAMTVQDDTQLQGTSKCLEIRVPSPPVLKRIHRFAEKLQKTSKIIWFFLGIMEEQTNYWFVGKQVQVYSRVFQKHRNRRKIRAVKHL